MPNNMVAIGGRGKMRFSSGLINTVTHYSREEVCSNDYAKRKSMSEFLRKWGCVAQWRDSSKVGAEMSDEWKEIEERGTLVTGALQTALIVFLGWEEKQNQLKMGNRKELETWRNETMCLLEISARINVQSIREQGLLSTEFPRTTEDPPANGCHEN